MIELAIVATRWLQYVGAAILCGSSLFFVYAVVGPLAQPLRRDTRRLLISGAAVLTGSSLLAIGLQASLFAGSVADGFAFPALRDVVAYMPLGKAALARSIVAGAALLLLATLPVARGTWLAAGSLGVIATTSLAWMGHAAASENSAHVAADIVHALAAAVWIGALFSFALLTRRPFGASNLAQLHDALLRFSMLGIPLILVLALSGVMNSWYLVGPANFNELPSHPYGQLLLLKLFAFAAMLAVAVINRYRLTPALSDQSGGAGFVQLRRSILLEGLLGAVTLGLVAWLGRLEPLALS